MEFYGLVRVGPKNLFSRRAAKKATQEAATSEQKKNMKKSKKSSGEKCTNHTPLLRGRGGQAGPHLGPRQRHRTHAVTPSQGRSEVGEQRTENSTAGAEEGRQFFTDLESAYRATSFEYLLSSRISSPHTHIGRDIQEVFSVFPFSQCLGLGISRLSFFLFFAVLDALFMRLLML